MTREARRIVWLIPSLLRGSYWAPFLNAIGSACPNTVVVTAAVEEEVQALLEVEVVQVGRLRSVGHRSTAEGYHYGVNLLSLGVIPVLWRLRPTLIVACGFSIWTCVALVLRPALGCRVGIYIAGGSKSANLARRPLRLAVRKFIARSVDILLTNSRAGAKYLEHGLGASSGRIHAFPMMVQAAQPVRRSAGRKRLEEPLSVTYVGRLEPAKGVGELLSALEEVARDTRARDWVLTVVGDGADRSSLESAVAASLVLNKKVRFVGWKTPHEVSEYLGQADIFVYPTHDDIWGSAAIEAMAHGVPVVVSMSAGMVDLVEDGVNGVTFPAGSVAKLAECLVGLLREPDQLEPMGQRARQTVVVNSATSAARQFLRATSEAGRVR